MIAPVAYALAAIALGLSIPVPGAAGTTLVVASIVLVWIGYRSHTRGGGGLALATVLMVAATYGASTATNPLRTLLVWTAAVLLAGVMLILVDRYENRPR